MRPSRSKYDTYVSGEPPAGIERVELYVPAYDTLSTPIDLGAIVPQMRSLRAVQTLTAGTEHVAPHVPDGVTLCNARGVHDAATSEMAMALMLASIRRIPEFVRAQPTHEWRHDTSGPALADSRVLILGYGSIGEALARRLEPFECDVVKVARTARDGVRPMSELPALLPTADVVVLLVPLTAETRHLVDAGFLARMRDGALLVNVARGGVVDSDALLAETRSGRLLAALDVTEPEPLPAGHGLWDSPGVLVSPHVAGGSTAMVPRMHALVRAQLARFAAGDDLLNVVR
ncbi:2-hydroxyacid dehydrogenase [Solicola gregarius]|uniref:2-hydroxyacid dehydrogenase n=1 Tax=Solicola gregarius TaxID=2908642 RepID=A0AA46YKT6_9ACTN|nr:2-hydroxyacid dehydrogenase [Solicola gregarius]UYM05832.1 2-hydroxyacid dehydrogenase [Solicola gregarius]